MIINEDKLKDYRTHNKEETAKFYKWLEKNCTKATSHLEVRKILNNVKNTWKKN